jgi:hypothetical protein
MRFVPIQICEALGGSELFPGVPYAPSAVLTGLERRYGPRLVVVRGRRSVRAVFPFRVSVEIDGDSVRLEYAEGSSAKSRELDLCAVRGALEDAVRASAGRAARAA